LASPYKCHRKHQCKCHINTTAKEATAIAATTNARTNATTNANQILRKCHSNPAPSKGAKTHTKAQTTTPTPVQTHSACDSAWRDSKMARSAASSIVHSALTICRMETKLLSGWAALNRALASLENICAGEGERRRHGASGGVVARAEGGVVHRPPAGHAVSAGEKVARRHSGL